MSQHAMTIANQAGAAFRADLNNALGAIATNNSGATAPSTTYAYQWWPDTANGILKQRNSTNTGWVSILDLATGTPVSSTTVGANSYISSLGNNTSTIYTTGGTSTAYTITPAPTYSAYATGMSFMVNFSAASGAAPTLAINGIASPPQLVKENLDGTYSNLAANDIPINHRSRVTLISTTQALVETIPRIGALASWTPQDGSGAGLSLTTSATYVIVGGIVHAFAQVAYPATASGANAAISNLPVNFPAAGYGRQATLNYTNAAAVAPYYFLPTSSSATMGMFKLNGAAVLNSDLSGTTMFFTCIYPAS